MTRPTLTNYPNIELPTIDGDQNVWGQVLNQSVQDLSAQTKTNEDNVATATASIATLNADVNTVGSVLKSIEDALTTLKGGSTNTLAEIEALITSNGTTDVSSINSAISNLQANLGAPTSSTLSTSVKSLADANETKVDRLIGTDTTMSVREIVADVLGSSSTGISGTAAQTMIDNSIAAITGTYTGTLQALKQLIDDIDGRLQTVEAAVTTLQNSQVSSSDFTALQATVNGSSSITGLVTRMSSAEGTLTSVSQTATDAQSTANSFSGQISSLGARTTALEDSDFVTSSTLNSYASKQYVTDQNFLQDADLNGYVTTGILNGYNFLTSNDLTNYIKNDDYSYVRLRGMLGFNDGVIPNMVDVGSDGTNRVRFFNGEMFLGGVGNSTAIRRQDAGRLAYLLYGDSANFNREFKQQSLYLRQNASNYGRFDLYDSGLPYFKHLVTNKEYSLISSGGSSLTSTQTNDLEKLNALFVGPTSAHWSSRPTVIFIGTDSYSTSYIRIFPATTGTQTWTQIIPYANNMQGTMTALVQGTLNGNVG